jgi:hypothetical protein
LQKLFRELASIFAYMMESIEEMKGLFSTCPEVENPAIKLKRRESLDGW